jgi:hypothetical protein
LGANVSTTDERRSRAMVDAVLAREGLDPGEEVRDRLARQLATMDAFRARLRTVIPSRDAATEHVSSTDTVSNAPHGDL